MTWFFLCNRLNW